MNEIMTCSESDFRNLSCVSDAAYRLKINASFCEVFLSEFCKDGCINGVRFGSLNNVLYHWRGGTMFVFLLSSAGALLRC
ncbi:UNVERIFIED_CONTAM: hypothetical protein NCL1_10762 [Trichonephila clavipes]